MPSFKEFLEDYARKEDEEAHIFYGRLARGQVSKDDMLPGKDRFAKICEPIAIASAVPVWSMVPFYGSTLVPLHSSYNKREFDLTHDITLGFSSRDLDRMIDFSKATGRLQFILFGNPTEYDNLDFLEPLLRELRPPAARSFMPTCMRSHSRWMMMSFPERHKIICCKCGKEDFMPFVPDGRPMYCYQCHRLRRLEWQDRHWRLAETRKKLEADERTKTANLAEGKVRNQSK